jgi:hypothetical protein
MSSYACKNLHKCINYQLFIPKCIFFRYFIVNLLLYSTILIYFCAGIEGTEGQGPAQQVNSQSSTKKEFGE